jgi:hypothetical protein
MKPLCKAVYMLESGQGNKKVKQERKKERRTIQIDDITAEVEILMSMSSGPRATVEHRRDSGCSCHKHIAVDAVLSCTSVTLVQIPLGARIYGRVYLCCVAPTQVEALH